MGVGVVDRGGVAEVSDGLTGVLGTAKEHGVGALGLAEGELVEGDALTTGLGDTSSAGTKQVCLLEITIRWKNSEDQRIILT